MALSVKDLWGHVLRSAHKRIGQFPVGNPGSKKVLLSKTKISYLNVTILPKEYILRL
jgi:hypothetical protein